MNHTKDAKVVSPRICCNHWAQLLANHLRTRCRFWVWYLEGVYTFFSAPIETWTLFVDVSWYFGGHTPSSSKWIRLWSMFIIVISKQLVYISARLQNYWSAYCSEQVATDAIRWQRETSLSNHVGWLQSFGYPGMTPSHGHGHCISLGGISQRFIAPKKFGICTYNCVYIYIYIILYI